MSIRQEDDRFSEIVDVSAIRETLSEGFAFIEGPIWHPTEHHLIFSDILESRLYRWQEGTDLAIYREPTNMANGNTYDREGRILTCEHASSQVRRDTRGVMEVLASQYQGRELNSPNDIVVRDDGAILFTDPFFGRTDQHGNKREPELDFAGVYLLDPDTRELTLLIDDLAAPNGLCLGLDGVTLYVADTHNKLIRCYQLEGNSISGGEIFAETRAPDGLKIDSLGNVYAGGPEGVSVFHHDDGTRLGIFETPEFCANFAWGGADLCTLFLTASTALYRVPVRTPGIPLF